ncbi:MAG: tetratricopeptide repeat protein [Crocinitomix sp.]|nr:tetratricopeptide repeat protein [Crocinitomix sp.]
MKTPFLILFIFFISLAYGQTNTYSFALAYKAHIEENYDEAIRIYSLIIENNSEPWEAYQNRAICYRMQKKFDLAKRDLDHVLIENPNDTMALYTYGVVECDQFNWSESISYLHKANQLTKERNQELLAYLGSAYFFAQEMDSAVNYLKQAIDLDPNDGDALNNLAWSYLSIEPSKSIQYFKMAYELDKTDPVALNNLGYAELLSGKFEIAKEHFLESKKMNQNNPFVYRNMGLYYMKINNKKAAKKQLKKCLKKGMLEKWGPQYIVELKAYCES